jgi:hypothetical protein
MSDLWKIKRTRKAGVKPNINQFTDSQTVIWNQADGKLWGLRIDGDGNRHVVLIGGGINTIGETHARLHAIDSEDDHAPAQATDYGKLVRANPITGAVEYSEVFSQSVLTVSADEQVNFTIPEQSDNDKTYVILNGIRYTHVEGDYTIAGTTLTWADTELESGEELLFNYIA